MDDIEQRLKDATEACLKTHGEWSKNKKDSKTREGLMEAVHELRKVAARMEIEIAISERDEMASKPIPIPPHRSNKRKQNDDSGDDDNAGNAQPKPPRSGGGGGGGGGPRPRRKSAGGGGGGNDGGE